MKVTKAKGRLRGKQTGRSQGGQPNRWAMPKLGPSQVKLARQMYEGTGDDGKRKYTVQQIADESASPAPPSTDSCPRRPLHPDFHHRSVGYGVPTLGLAVGNRVLGFYHDHVRDCT
jgi:hypothetical protein